MYNNQTGAKGNEFIYSNELSFNELRRYGSKKYVEEREESRKIPRKLTLKEEVRKKEYESKNFGRFGSSD
jgi:hypothetical protein